MHINFMDAVCITFIFAAIADTETFSTGRSCSTLVAGESVSSTYTNVMTIEGLIHQFENQEA